MPELPQRERTYRLFPLETQANTQWRRKSNAGRCDFGYTRGMKTTVSIPADLFERAERLARRTKKSRSRLFRDAVTEYLARHTSDQITEQMDKALDEIGVGEDRFVSTAARQILDQTEW